MCARARACVHVRVCVHSLFTPRLHATGVPFLGLLPLGIEGLWYGTAAGYFVMVTWLLVYCSRIDWQLQAQLAVARSANRGAATTESQETKNADGEEAPLMAREGDDASE